ncbi:CotH kinase family protein [Desulfitobacterium hafniense]|uniref:CotH kinase family protein n=1 Tax=Desulfitobacterium hafniense TaxID=49338 RepID=UPI00037AAB86|nr:CotH kinase family protein [Desulfitobacterium hafniense]
MNKKLISLLISGLLLVSLAGCDSLSASAAQTQEQTGEASSGYAGTIFDTSYVHEINVAIAEADWADLLANPTEKTKYTVNVTIDGNELSDVSFATKGSTSLTQVANTDSDRYSFKLNFGKNVDGQTYDGLDKLNLNNLYSDATYLKDYLSYRTMAEAGVAAPLVSFVSLSINGEVHGLYLAVEEVGDSFLARNYGEDAGELYKPESSQFANIGAAGMNGGMPPARDGEGANGGELPEKAGPGMPDNGGFTMPEGWEGKGEGFGGDGGDMRGGFGGNGFGESSNGASLVYTDDEISSYSDIFDNAETAADEEDYQRVIEALKQLSTGEDLDTSVDVEAVLRYFVAHNFTVNYDSYTGNMLHNYYLYEEAGILTMLPWDYNLAFGGFNGSTATENVNWPIDSPLSDNVSEEDRPMWSMLATNEEYLTLYHNYFDELISGYFESGRFESELDTLYELIRPYVEADPTAFYILEEFDTAVETLKTFCTLRAESIRGQLDGNIPSTAEGQQEDNASLIDAGGINMKSMGGMSGGRGNGEDRGQEMRPDSAGMTGGGIPDATGGPSGGKN